MVHTRGPSMTDEMEEEIEQQLRDSKGIGNFPTIQVNIPGGDGDAIKFIEMGDISAKDEFASVKNISAQDISRPGLQVSFRRTLPGWAPLKRLSAPTKRMKCCPFNAAWRWPSTAIQ